MLIGCGNSRVTDCMEISVCVKVYGWCNELVINFGFCLIAMPQCLSLVRIPWYGITFSKNLSPALYRGK